MAKNTTTWMFNPGQPCCNKYCGHYCGPCGDDPWLPYEIEDENGKWPISRILRNPGDTLETDMYRPLWGAVGFIPSKQTTWDVQVIGEDEADWLWCPTTSIYNASYRYLFACSRMGSGDDKFYLDLNWRLGSWSSTTDCRPPKVTTFDSFAGTATLYTKPDNDYLVYGGYGDWPFSFRLDGTSYYDFYYFTMGATTTSDNCREILFESLPSSAAYVEHIGATKPYPNLSYKQISEYPPLSRDISRWAIVRQKKASTLCSVRMLNCLVEPRNLTLTLNLVDGGTVEQPLIFNGNLFPVWSAVIGGRARLNISKDFCMIHDLAGTYSPCQSYNNNTTIDCSPLMIVVDLQNCPVMRSLGYSGFVVTQ